MHFSAEEATIASDCPRLEELVQHSSTHSQKDTVLVLGCRTWSKQGLRDI
jgi:hypothetical protein